MRFRSFLLFFSVLLFAQQERLLTHVTPAGSLFETQLILRNGSSLAKQIQLTPYSETGQAYESLTLELQANEERLVQSTQLFDGVPVSHIKISGSQEIRVFALYASQLGQGAQPVLSEVTELGKGYLVHSALPSPDADLWEGFALVNPTPILNRILITRQQGSQSESVEVVVAGEGKRVQLFDSLFKTPTSAEPRPRYLFRAQRPFSLVILGGSGDLRSTWALATQPDARVAAQPIHLIFEWPDNPSSDPLILLSASIQEDLLRLQMSYSVTCDYQLELVSNAAFMESNPVKVVVRLNYLQIPSGYCIRQFEQQDAFFNLASLASRYREHYGEQGEMLILIQDLKGQALGEISYKPFAN